MLKKPQTKRKERLLSHPCGRVATAKSEYSDRDRQSNVCSGYGRQWCEIAWFKDIVDQATIEGYCDCIEPRHHGGTGKSKD
jgi:hypothetical protein